MAAQNRLSKPRGTGGTAPSRRSLAPPQIIARSPSEISLDPYRAFVFPNRVREQRQRGGLLKLMALSNRLPDIPYIRLSKIERGEVVARADELTRIASTLDIGPADLLIDVDAAGFDIAVWAEPFRDVAAWNEADEREAVLLGAALRVRRNQDRALTITVLDRDYGLPAVILSRIENAQKTLDRWNATTLASLCRLFGVRDTPALKTLIGAEYRGGELDGYVKTIADPELRIARTRQRIAEVRAALALAGADPSRPVLPAKTIDSASPPPLAAVADRAAAGERRELRVYGTPLPGGLIAKSATDGMIEAPGRAGPRAFALRVCRATLGAGLPANAIVVVDPDRPPAVGGIAAIRTGDAYRLVTITFDRSGSTVGYSVTPDMEVVIDDLDPADVAAVICAVFP